jgi:hypothetical protein
MNEYLFIEKNSNKLFKTNKFYKNAKFISQGFTFDKFYSYNKDDKFYITKILINNDQKLENISGYIYKIDSYVLFNIDLEKGYPIEVCKNIVNVLDNKGKIYNCLIYFDKNIIEDKKSKSLDFSKLLSDVYPNFIYKDLVENFDE